MRVLPAMMMALLAMAAGAGCGQQAAGGNLESFLLLTEPENPMSLLDVREAQPSAGSIAIVGRIGGVAHPWIDGRAAFVMTDPSLGASHGDSDECPDGCAFCCADEGPESLAVVEFVDAGGQVVGVDARKLLGLRRNDLVVVRGTTRVDDSGYLVVRADGIYLRR